MTKGSHTTESDITPFFRMGKLNDMSLWKIAGRHNFRETLPSKSHNIDATQSHLNEVLRGPKTSQELRDKMYQNIKRAGIPKKIRIDAVWAIEVVFSLPRNHNLDEGAFFSSCIRWTETWCGGADNLLSAVVHRDEPAPHMHVLILPLINGRLNGSKLMGHPPMLRSRHQNFFKEVAAPFGLKDSRSSAEIFTSSKPYASNRDAPHEHKKPMLCSVCKRRVGPSKANNELSTNFDFRLPTFASWAQTEAGAAFLATCGMAWRDQPPAPT